MEPEVQVTSIKDNYLFVNVFAFRYHNPARLFKSCRFITAVHACLKVPAKNSPALLFLSRGKAADCYCFSFFFFSPVQEEQSRGILGGNFQTRMHNSNKAAGLKETGWSRGVVKGGPGLPTFGTTKQVCFL